MRGRKKTAGKIPAVSFVLFQTDLNGKCCLGKSKNPCIYDWNQPAYWCRCKPRSCIQKALCIFSRNLRNRKHSKVCRRNICHLRICCRRNTTVFFSLLPDNWARSMKRSMPNFDSQSNWIRRILRSPCSCCIWSSRSFRCIWYNCNTFLLLYCYLYRLYYTTNNWTRWCSCTFPPDTACRCRRSHTFPLRRFFWTYGTPKRTSPPWNRSSVPTDTACMTFWDRPRCTFLWGRKRRTFRSGIDPRRRKCVRNSTNCYTRRA